MENECYCSRWTAEGVCLACGEKTLDWADVAAGDAACESEADYCD
jgi:hypothetical protein